MVFIVEIVKINGVVILDVIYFMYECVLVLLYILDLLFIICFFKLEVIVNIFREIKFLGENSYRKILLLI